MKLRTYADVKMDISNEDISKKNLIYKLTFPDDKVYIGLTRKTLKERLHQHITTAFNKNLDCFTTKKARAIRKYLTFKVEVLCVSEDNNLEELEINYIKEYNSYKKGYNSTMGGEGTYGREMSEEQKEIHRQNSIRLQTHKYIDNRKIVLQYSLDGEFIKEWESAKAADTFYNNEKARNVSNTASGKQKTAYGYKWKYKETN